MTSKLRWPQVLEVLAGLNCTNRMQNFTETECDKQTEVATGTGGAGRTELHQQNRDILQ